MRKMPPEIQISQNFCWRFISSSKNPSKCKLGTDFNCICCLLLSLLNLLNAYSYINDRFCFSRIFIAYVFFSIMTIELKYYWVTLFPRFSICSFVRNCFQQNSAKGLVWRIWLFYFLIYTCFHEFTEYFILNEFVKLIKAHENRLFKGSTWWFIFVKRFYNHSHLVSRLLVTDAALPALNETGDLNHDQ